MPIHRIEHNHNMKNFLKLEKPEKTSLARFLQITSAKPSKTLHQTLKKISPLLRFLVPLLVISMFSLYLFASTIAVTSSPVLSENGVIFNVNGGFTISDNGFSIAQSIGVASTQPIQWSKGDTCQTALTSGDWYYSITLTITASALTSHTYTATVSWNTGTGYSTLKTPLTFTTPATIIAGQTMNFDFDAGTNLTVPAAITITVA